MIVDHEKETRDILISALIVEATALVVKAKSSEEIRVIQAKKVAQAIEALGWHCPTQNLK